MSGAPGTSLARCNHEKEKVEGSEWRDSENRGRGEGCVGVMEKRNPRFAEENMAGAALGIEIERGGEERGRVRLIIAGTLYKETQNLKFKVLETLNRFKVPGTLNLRFLKTLNRFKVLENLKFKVSKNLKCIQAFGKTLNLRFPKTLNRFKVFVKTLNLRF